MARWRPRLALGPLRAVVGIAAMHRRVSRFSSGMFGPEENIMKHRGTDFDVEENPPSWWHWKIYTRREGGQTVIANMKFQTREAAVDACIVEINCLLDKGQRDGGSEIH